MICGNCRQHDCPAPTATATYERCGNGYQVSKTTTAQAIAIDWQTRAEEAERLVREQHLALAHETAANGELQGQIAVLGIEADRREASYRELAGSLAAQEDRDDAACARVGIPPHGCDTSDTLADEVLALRAQLLAANLDMNGAAVELAKLRGQAEAQAETLARVREVAERHAQLDVSNGSWKAAARDVAGKILRALEGK